MGVVVVDIVILFEPHVYFIWSLEKEEVSFHKPQEQSQPEEESLSQDWKTEEFIS